MAEREALLVGIDHYKEEEQLDCCVADANAMADLLGTHADGTENWHTRTLVSSEDEPVTRVKLREALVDLFDESDGMDLLFYFSGHGGISALGPELFTTDGQPPSSYGVSMHEVAMVAQQCEASTVTIILDCCAAGTFGDATITPSDFDTVTLRQGVSLMAACRATEEAEEEAPHGIFTQLLLDGIRGAAADLHGRVTTLGLHALTSAALSTNADQNPVLKAHSIDGPVIRGADPLIGQDRLGRIRARFTDPATPLLMSADQASSLGVVDETDMATELVQDLRAYVQAGLIGASTAADGEIEVCLNLLGQHYWRTTPE